MNLYDIHKDWLLSSQDTLGDTINSRETLPIASLPFVKGTSTYENWEDKTIPVRLMQRVSWNDLVPVVNSSSLGRSISIRITLDDTLKINPIGIMKAFRTYVYMWQIRKIFWKE